MTHPLGKQWSQPDRSAIKLYGDEAIMDKNTFDALPTYNTSTPSGVYAGKMWKCKFMNDKWQLCWYYDKPEKPDVCGIAYLSIVLIGTEDISEAGLRQWMRRAIYDISIECETIRMCWKIESLRENGGTYSDNLADYGL